MTTITLRLPDDILEVARLEAEYFGTTAEERIERLVEKTHWHRVTHPAAKMQTHIARIERGEVPGDGRPLREFLPTGAEK